MKIYINSQKHSSDISILNFSILQQVIRELDIKKPQLDDLVHMAENIKKEASHKQLQNKGKNTKLLRTSHADEILCRTNRIAIKSIF